MHEYSLARRLVEMVEEEAARSEAGTITQVTVRIGPFSPVEAPLLQEAFKRCRHGACADASLVIHLHEMLGHCPTCHRDIRSGTLRFDCPDCGTPLTELHGMQEIELVGLTLKNEVKHDD
jgi:hydrogenase nickel incorporation protein HypA/HybF